MESATDYKLPEGHSLCLRTNNADNRSYNEFQWPEIGECVAHDWSSEKVCGQGLHGMLWGMGDSGLLNWGPDAKWLVVEVLTESIVNLEGKVKFPRCRVIFSGDRLGATNLITKFAPVGTLVMGGFSTSGDNGVSTSGDRGFSTSGDRGVSTSGYSGVSTSGDRGVSTSGNRGVSTSGDSGVSTSGYSGFSTSGDNGVSTSGDRGVSTSGDSGVSTSGDNGVSTSGYSGFSTSGDRGVSTSGYSGVSTSGDRGVLNLSWWDPKAKRRRVVTKYVGEDGIKPNTPYAIDDDGDVTEVKKGVSDGDCKRATG